MLLHEIKATNLLSFGPDGLSVELRPLNVLIGPNGSGKSNLLEAVALLRAAPTHLATPVRDGGGVRDWIWKGGPGASATLEAVVDNPKGNMPLRHVIEFTESSQKFQLTDERIENVRPHPGEKEPYFFYRFQHGRPILNVLNGNRRGLHPEDVASDESILSQRKDPDQYPEITYLGQVYARIRQHRDWSFGRFTVPRQPQKADLPNDSLDPDFGNIGLVLNRLRRDATVKRSILENLKQLYAGIEDYDVSVEGGTVQVFFHESGFTIPATRLSDGTLRYLCLLAILCDPDPPPLICIEEPELGLHPDLLPKVADLLVEASTRTQLVVTTHSDILVDAMTEHPDDVLVFEKRDGCTRARRLEAKELTTWLEKYRLGELWLRGEIGGTRW